MSNERTDPYRVSNFILHIEKVNTGSFSEVSGLSTDGEAIEYREGTDIPLNVRKLIGLRKYSNITLKRGYTPNMELWNWYTHIQNGTPDRRDGTITLLDEERKPVLRWHFERGWINKIEGPGLKASGNDVAIESVEIVHEGLTLELAGAGG
jgi:phage tail-like protein